MRCVFCNAEIEEDDVFCPNCGKKLPEVETHKPEPQKNEVAHSKKNTSNRIYWVIVLLIALLCILLGIILYLSLKGSGSNPQIEDNEVAPVSQEALVSDSMEQQAIQDSIMLAARIEADAHVQQKPPKKKPVSTNTGVKPPVTRSSGVKNLGYATYRGPLAKGKPHGVNGKMTYKSAHIIDSRDPKGRVAEPGDYIIGEYYEGHLVQGVWYSSIGRQKGSVLIGR